MLLTGLSMWMLTGPAEALDLTGLCPDPSSLRRPFMMGPIAPEMSAELDTNKCSIAVDPEEENGCSSHYAWIPPEGTPSHQDQLMVMLPGMKQRPNQFFMLQSNAAFAGYRTVGLSFHHSISVVNWCPLVGPDVTQCWLDAEREIIFGDEDGVTMFGAVERVDPVDSLSGRLVSLLETLYWMDVDADGTDNQDWDRYLTVPIVDRNTPIPRSETSLKWDEIIVVGFSISAMDVAVLTHDRLLNGAIYIDGPQDDLPDMHIFDDVYATPACVQQGAFHGGRGQPTIDINAIWDQIGIDTSVYGVDLNPWSGTWPTEGRIETNQLPAPGGCIDPLHGSMARDGCMPTDPWNAIPAGRGFGPPNLFAGYTYLFCAVGEIDPYTCQPYQDLAPRDPVGPRL